MILIQFERLKKKKDEARFVETFFDNYAAVADVLAWIQRQNDGELPKETTIKLINP